MSGQNHRNTDIMGNVAQQRRAREYQAKHRGTERSYLTELEDALLFLAWEAEQLSEGQMSHLLDTDRVSIRIRREEMLARAMKLAESMFELNKIEEGRWSAPS